MSGFSTRELKQILAGKTAIRVTPKDKIRIKNTLKEREARNARNRRKRASKNPLDLDFNIRGL